MKPKSIKDINKFWNNLKNDKELKKQFLHWVMNEKLSIHFN